jgi:hypothetical protein
VVSDFAVVAAPDGRAQVTLTTSAGASVTLLHKSISGLTDWSRTVMTSDGSGHFSTISDEQFVSGGLYATEIQSSSGTWRWPDVTLATPYVTLAPQP